ncbi:hypothetical protein Patl1_05176 [Pistacia atlantica]|uniref:Uncharacterized protein n=1 Tax=Pistacia atlantica TaxID=434234 RepID=A0ACC1BRR1_9ROSI|nr:hypothetical protein Patl1_05176 [Pistacia atlantica]
MSGLRVYVAKTSILFSKNVTKHDRLSLIEKSGFKLVNNLGRYLGVQVKGGCNKKELFHDVVHRIQSRLSSWRMKNLSLAGCSVALFKVIELTRERLTGDLEANRNVASFVNENGGRKLVSYPSSPHPTPLEVNKVQAVLPPMPSDDEDLICWRPTSHGKFTVNSCYNQIMDWKVHDRNALWQQLWRIKAFQRMLLFMWRFFHDRLPTNVQRRKWSDCDEATLETRGNGRAPHNFTTYVQWRRPPLGWIKLNTDEISRSSENGAGGGGLLRNYEGSWICGYIGNIGMCSAFLAEAWTILDGLNLAWSLRILKNRT